MRLIFVLVLMAGLGLAALAASLIQGYVSQKDQQLAQQQASAAQKVDVVPVLAAKREVTYGERLTPEDVEIVGYAAPYLPEGTFGTLEDFFGAGNQEPRTVLVPLQPREVILSAKVTEPGSDAGLGSRLQPGMRAFTIRTDVSSGVSGFLRPGDRVDVYWTGGVPGGGDVTRLIRSSVEILAIDQTADARGAGAMIARTVTVQASPQDVAALAQAQSTGRLSLALVGFTDDTVSDVIEVDQQTLLGIEDLPEPAPQAPAPAICTVRTRNTAGEIITTEVPCLQ